MDSLEQIIRNNAPKPATKLILTGDTIHDIVRAQRNADAIANKMLAAARCGYAANLLFRADAPRATIDQLRVMREAIISIRRTQLAAIEAIDAAIASAKGTL